MQKQNKITFVKSEYINNQLIPCKQWNVFLNGKPTRFQIEGANKKYYNKMYSNPNSIFYRPTFKKNSLKTYGVYENDPECIDGFCNEFSTLKEAKDYIRKCLQTKNN